MYTIDTGNNIEFYYKDLTILQLAEMYSAYKAARTEGGLDNINFTTDEQDVGVDMLNSIYVEIFGDLEKQMVDDLYLSNIGTGHGSDAYSGFYIWDNSAYSESLLIMFDSMVTQAAWTGLLSRWYTLTNNADMVQYYQALYATKLAALHNLAFILRKPTGVADLSFSSSTMSDRILVDIPFRTEYEVPHGINNTDYVVELYDLADGKEVNVLILKREVGKVTLYSNVALTDIVVYVMGNR